MLRASDDVIDWNMNQLYKKSNEVHDGKSDYVTNHFIFLNPTAFVYKKIDSYLEFVVFLQEI